MFDGLRIVSILLFCTNATERPVGLKLIDGTLDGLRLFDGKIDGLLEGLLVIGVNTKSRINAFAA